MHRMAFLVIYMNERNNGNLVNIFFLAPGVFFLILFIIYRRHLSQVSRSCFIYLLLIFTGIATILQY